MTLSYLSPVQRFRCPGCDSVNECIEGIWIAVIVNLSALAATLAAEVMLCMTTFSHESRLGVRSRHSLPCVTANGMKFDIIGKLASARGIQADLEVYHHCRPQRASGRYRIRCGWSASRPRRSWQLAS